MKRCPSCNRTYTDVSLNFCLEDGTPLVSDVPNQDPAATVRYPPVRDTVEPPPTEIYHPESADRGRPNPPPQAWTPVQQPQAWTPPRPQAPPRKKSNAVWWILGGVVLVGIIGIGLLVVVVLLASIGSQLNANDSNSNSNARVANANTNTASNSRNTNSSNSNASTSTASLTDDFSEQKWGTGSSKFGDIWYADGEYHMRSKKDTYLVMYAPNDDYKTGNATVKVTARSVDGTSPSNGFGLIVNGEQSKTKGLQDYALLIYPSEQAAFEVITHKDGGQMAIVPKTLSRVIRSGTNPNQLEVRIKGADLSFYANGQYLTRITDASNFRNGLAGFYTSDTSEVAFDDLEIKR